jgi:uncharacterized protein (DUF362 family)
MKILSRREALALAGATLLQARPPAAPVSVARCGSYREDVAGVMGAMFDQLGGLGGLVRGKTVALKLNMTGSPALRIGGRPLGATHYCHPKVVGALVHHLGRAGAKRIRLIESGYGTDAPLEEYMLDSGWNVRSFLRAAEGVEFENTNTAGKAARYSRFAVPGGGRIFPAYDLNHSFADTDVLVSVAKLKEHETCGITLSLKNCFGNLPASIYGDDAGVDEPNEKPEKGRLSVCHLGKRQPSRSAPGELDPASSRDPGYRVPWIVAELCAARPIHLAIIDGVESITGGEGPWIQGVRVVRPGVLIAGLNPVSTDAVGAAVMGFDPRAPRGRAPFAQCENTLLLAEALGVGSADLDRIEVRGAAIDDVRFPFSA